MKKTIFLVTLAVCMLLSSWKNYADESTQEQTSLLQDIRARGELRVGVNPSYFPFEMFDKQGELIGFNLDLGHEIALELGVTLVPIKTSWDGIIPRMVEGQFDIILSMLITEERAGVIDFSHPYIEVGQRMLLHPKHQHTITSYQQVNAPEYHVVTQRGTTAEQVVRRLLPKARCTIFERIENAAYSVVQGEADAVVYDLPFCLLFQKMVGEDAILLLDEALTIELLAIAVPKGEGQLRRELNMIIQKIRDDGRYSSMYQKWFLETEWFQQVE